LTEVLLVNHREMDVPRFCRRFLEPCEDRVLQRFGAEREELDVRPTACKCEVRQIRWKRVVFNAVPVTPTVERDGRFGLAASVRF
jgi:hypothetical protein